MVHSIQTIKKPYVDVGVQKPERVQLPSNMHNHLHSQPEPAPASGPSGPARHAARTTRDNVGPAACRQP